MRCCVTAALGSCTAGRGVEAIENHFGKLIEPRFRRRDRRRLRGQPCTRCTSPADLFAHVPQSGGCGSSIPDRERRYTAIVFCPRCGQGLLDKGDGTMKCARGEMAVSVHMSQVLKAWVTSPPKLRKGGLPEPLRWGDFICPRCRSEERRVGKECRSR